MKGREGSPPQWATHQDHIIQSPAAILGKLYKWRKNYTAQLKIILWTLLHLAFLVIYQYISVKPITTLLPPGGEDQGGDGQPWQGHRGKGLPLFMDQDWGVGGGLRRRFFKIECYIIPKTLNIFFYFNKIWSFLTVLCYVFFYMYIFLLKLAYPVIFTFWRNWGLRKSLILSV